MSTLVKGQHVVWANLLRGWEVDGRLWCFRRQGEKLFRTQSTAVAKETFFYRVRELLDEDRDRLQYTVAQCTDPRLRDLNQGWIDWIERVFETRKRLTAAGLSAADRQKIGDDLDRLEKMMVEKWHTGVENRATGPLDELRSGSNAFYDDPEQRNAWITYVAFQYFRTSSLKQRLKADFGSFWNESMERTWPLEALIYSTNVGAGIVSRASNYGCALLEQGSNIPFITGDQPIVNLKTDKDADLQLYVPVSPRYAALMGPKEDIGPLHRRISALETERLNHKIHSRSADQIYGSDPEYLGAVGRLERLP